MNGTEPEWIGYKPARGGELYANQVDPYYRAPHIYLGFPTPYFERGWIEGMDALPQSEHRLLKGARSPREGSAVTEGMFISSRDAVTFDVSKHSIRESSLAQAIVRWPHVEPHAEQRYCRAHPLRPGARQTAQARLVELSSMGS